MVDANHHPQVRFGSGDNHPPRSTVQVQVRAPLLAQGRPTLGGVRVACADMRGQHFFLIPVVDDLEDLPAGPPKAVDGQHRPTVWIDHTVASDGGRLAEFRFETA